MVQEGSATRGGQHTESSNVVASPLPRVEEEAADSHSFVSHLCRFTVSSVLSKCAFFSAAVGNRPFQREEVG